MKLLSVALKDFRILFREITYIFINWHQGLWSWIFIIIYSYDVHWN